jgi:hypothetical protein
MDRGPPGDNQSGTVLWVPGVRRLLTGRITLPITGAYRGTTSKSCASFLGHPSAAIIAACMLFKVPEPMRVPEGRPLYPDAPPGTTHRRLSLYRAERSVEIRVILT